MILPLSVTNEDPHSRLKCVRRKAVVPPFCFCLLQASISDGGEGGRLGFFQVFSHSKKEEEQKSPRPFSHAGMINECWILFKKRLLQKNMYFRLCVRINAVGEKYEFFFKKNREPVKANVWRTFFDTFCRTVLRDTCNFQKNYMHIYKKICAIAGKYTGKMQVQWRQPGKEKTECRTKE